MTAAGMAAFIVLGAATAQANGLRTETGRIERVAESKLVRVDARVTWKNGWRNSRNYDAVWVVIKLRGSARAAWAHGRLVRAVSQGEPQATCTVSKNLTAGTAEALSRMTNSSKPGTPTNPN